MYGELVGIDAFTVSLHSPNGRQMPAIRAVQGDCQWPWKWWKFPLVIWAQGSLQRRHLPTYIKTIQPQRGSTSHVPYPTDSPTATRLGLCISLAMGRLCWVWLTLVVFISINNVLIHWGLNKMAAVWQTFSYSFLDSKVLCFDWNFTEMCF